MRTLDTGDKVRERSETFADHYSQGRLFWRSMSEPEQRHIVNAFTFELSKVSIVGIRQRMLGHLANIDRELCDRVEEGLGMEGEAEQIKPARPPIDMKPSPALSLVKKAKKTLEGRKVGVLVTDGTDPALVASLRAAVEKAGARMQVVAPKIGGAAGKGGKRIAADHQLAGGPSILFDAVVVAPSEDGAASRTSGNRRRRGHRRDRGCQGRRRLHRRGEERPCVGARADAADSGVNVATCTVSRRGDAETQGFFLFETSIRLRLCASASRQYV